MISSSAAFKAAVRENPTTLFSGVLTLADGRTINLSSADVMDGSQSYSEGVSSDGSFDVGAAIIGRFDFTLDNTDGRYDDVSFEGATIAPKVGKQLSGSTVWLQKGIYGIEQPDTYGMVISLSSLDNMRKFERPYSDVSTTYPASLNTILRDICTTCGVTLATSNFPNRSYSVRTRPEGDFTCIQMVSFVAQLAGCWAKCDNQGRLRLGWYDKSFFDSTPAEGTYAKLDMVSSMSVYTDDVVVTGVRMKAMSQVDQDGTRGNDGESYLYGAEGYVLELSDNPLCLYGSAQACATFIGQRVVGMRFRPFKATAIGDPSIEAGDPAILTDSRGVAHNTYITSLTYKTTGYESFACNADYPGRHKAASYSALTRAIADANRAIEKEKDAREIAVDNLAQQLASSSGLYMTAERQQDGSYIYYMHDQPTLAESQVVWKLTANAFAVSTDGGQTYPYGLDTNGDALLNRIYAIGLDADYIDTGRIAVSKNGKTLFMVDMDTGTFLIQDESGNNVWDSVNGFTLSSGGSQVELDDYIAMASTSAANNAASSIAVGGTNMLNGTNILKTVGNASEWSKGTWRGASGGTGARRVVDISGAPNNNITRGLEIVGNGSATDIAQDGIPVTDGQPYLLSCYAKGTGTLFMQVGTSPYLSVSAQVSHTTWKRYYFRFTAGSGKAGMSNGKTNAYFGNRGTGTLQICGMKLERGNKCSDWSPSPDDEKMFATEQANEAVKTAEATAGAKATDALNQAKTYTNAISKTDREFSESQRKALDASLNQAGVLKRLTNNYRAQGIYLKDGQLYINGTYVRTGTLDAGIIKAGILTDSRGQNKWNMASGYLETRNAVFMNANVEGQFTCGSYAKLELKGGQIVGYQNRSRVGYIDATANMIDINTGRTYAGIQVQGGVLRISTSKISVLNSTDIWNTTIHGWTGTKRWNVVSKVEGYGNGGLRWWTEEHGITCINGIVTSVW